MTTQLTIETIDIQLLSEDPANVRQHDTKNLATIRASLQRFGQVKPIVVDYSNVVRAGNGTLCAARELGWETIQIVRTELAGAEAIAYAIADNRTTDLSTFDNELLRAQLDSLDYELMECVGYDDADLQALADMVDNFDEPDTGDDDPIEPRYQVVVTCSSESSQRVCFEALQKQGYEVKAIQI